jgi:hypothetical protein
MSFIKVLRMSCTSLQKSNKKEVTNMKKVIIAMFAFAVIFSAANAFAADQTASVTATAKITAATSLSVAPSAITFATTSADSFASSPITVTYSSNYNPWKLAIYTDNTQVPAFGSTNGRYAKNGLATTDGLNVIPLKWVAQAPATEAPSIANIAAYNYVKDKRDEDDLSTVATATASNDESWDGSFAAGYCNIAYGSAASGTCVDPTKTPNYTGDPVTGTITVYVAGLFKTWAGGAGDYATSVGFDLYHE